MHGYVNFKVHWEPGVPTIGRLVKQFTRFQVKLELRKEGLKTDQLLVTNWSYCARPPILQIAELLQASKDVK